LSTVQHFISDQVPPNVVWEVIQLSAVLSCIMIYCVIVQIQQGLAITRLSVW